METSKNENGAGEMQDFHGAFEKGINGPLPTATGENPRSSPGTTVRSAGLTLRANSILCSFTRTNCSKSIGLPVALFGIHQLSFTRLFCRPGNKADVVRDVVECHHHALGLTRAPRGKLQKSQVFSTQRQLVKAGTTTPRVSPAGGVLAPPAGISTDQGRRHRRLPA